MPSFSVQNVIDRAAAIADMHDNFVSPAQWVAWFNSERTALQLFKCRHGASMQNMGFLTAVAPDRYDMSSGGVNQFLALVGVWEITSGGRLRPLRIVPFVDSFWQDNAGPITGASQTVSIEDANPDVGDVATTLRFFPRDTSGSYLIVYIKAPTPATSAASLFSEPVGLEERIVLGMAKHALIKEESDTAAVDGLIRDQDKIVEEYCWSRSFAQAPSVRNVDSLQRGWMKFDEFVPPSMDFWVWF